MPFEIIAFDPEARMCDGKFRPTESNTTLLSIVARAGLPVTAHTVTFLANNYGCSLEPDRLQVSDKSQFVAIGQHLEKVTLVYMLY